MKKYFILFILIVALTACSSNTKFEAYEGNPLKIAVVGELPDVKEDHVKLKKITFSDMTSDDLTSFDAVLIREKNLSQASKDQYADVYLHSPIPFFFIGTDQSFPFTEKDLAYDKTDTWNGGNYAVGVFASKEGEALKQWNYGLYNDEKTDEHLREMYSNIFRTIEQQLNS